MDKLKRDGAKLRQRVGALRKFNITNESVCSVARVSISTLHKIYRDDPKVRAPYYDCVESAIARLECESKVSA